MSDNGKVVRLRPERTRQVEDFSPSLGRRENGQQLFDAVEQLNAGRPWSELDEHDLRSAIADGMTSAEIAEFLCRSEPEVIAKAAELGYAALAEATIPMKLQITCSPRQWDAIKAVLYAAGWDGEEPPPLLPFVRALHDQGLPGPDPDDPEAIEAWVNENAAPAAPDESGETAH